MADPSAAGAEGDGGYGGFGLEGAQAGQETLLRAKQHDAAAGLPEAPEHREVVVGEIRGGGDDQGLRFAVL